MKLITDKAFYEYHNSDEAKHIREFIKNDFISKGGTTIQFDMWLTTVRYEMANQIGFDPSELNNDEFLTALIVIQHSSEFHGKDEVTDGEEK